MPRLARVVAVGIPHHITQRGNARRFILQDEADRKVYLDLLRQTTEQHGIVLIVCPPFSRIKGNSLTPRTIHV